MPPVSTLQRACAMSDRLRRTLPLLAVALATAAGPWTAATAADAPPAWEDKYANPKPADGDVVLPMPCGGAMAFRKVPVPSEGPLDDYQVTVGGGGDDVGYAEGPRKAYVSGSFPDGKNQRHFLLGKYEISQLQYRAVMDDTCPKPTMALRLPQGEVSWSDALRFTERYTTWLREKAADAVPKDGDAPGYVRLPTEIEWEYAARGGIAVSPADFNERTYPMPEGMARHVWFAGSQSANGKPQLTGLLQPNPLGLHDMLGNLDEVVLEPFRLNKLDRLHGQAGGFVVRGGNYLTSEGDIRTAYRTEVPYFDGAQPRRAKTTGFRVAVAAPVLTSAQRLKEVRAAWSKLGTVSAPDAAAPAAAPTTGALAGKPAADPVEELALLTDAVADPALKKRLEHLQTALRGNIAARDEQRDRAAKTALRMGAFLGRKLSDDAKAVDALADIYDLRVKSSPDDERTKDYKARLDRERRVLDDNLRYYADTVIRTADDYGPETIKRQKGVLEVELKNLGLGDLVPFVGQHTDHVLTYRQDRKVSRTRWLQEWSRK